MNIITLVEPPVEPVTVAEVYEFLRWDAEEEGSPPAPIFPLQDTISRHITTARIGVEQATRRSLVKQTLRLDRPCWPPRCDLLRPPVVDVVAVPSEMR